MTKYIGFEAANSFVKIKSDKGEESYPNTRKRVSSQRETMGFPAIDEADRTVYRVSGDNDAYMVGDVDGRTSSGRDIDRYESGAYRTEALIAIAKHVDNGDKVVVTTGLPATHYRVPRSENAVRKALEGEHTVYVRNRPRTFTVDLVKTILQPIGSLMYLMMGEDGNFRSNEARQLATGKKLVIDIGWGTTDIAELEGMDLTKRDGENIGMQTAYEYMHEWIINEHEELRNSSITLFKLDEVTRKGGILTVRNEDYDVSEFAWQAYKSAAEEIMGKVKERYSFDLYDRIIFTGGGIEALSVHLAKFVNVSHAIRVNDAQMANARGYYLHAKYVN